MNMLKLVMTCGVMSVLIGGTAVAQQAGGPAGQNTPATNTGPQPSPAQEQTTGGGGMTNSERSQTTGQSSQGGKMQPQMPVPKQNDRPEQPGK